jgi:hypothetical protein
MDNKENRGEKTTAARRPTWLSCSGLVPRLAKTKALDKKGVISTLFFVWLDWRCCSLGGCHSNWLGCRPPTQTTEKGKGREIHSKCSDFSNSVIFQWMNQWNSHTLFTHFEAQLNSVKQCVKFTHPFTGKWLNCEFHSKSLCFFLSW